MRSAARAARTHAPALTRNELLAVQEINVACIKERRPAASVDALDHAEARHPPPYPRESISPFRRIRERQPRLDAMEWWHLDRNGIGQTAGERADLLARFLGAAKAAGRAKQ